MRPAGHRPGISAWAPARLAQLVASLGVRYGAVRPRPDAVLEEALRLGQDCVDVTYLVRPDVVAAAGELERLMDEADALCRDGLLLTLPRDELERRFPHWYLEQIRRQIDGEPALSSDGPLQPG